MMEFISTDDYFILQPIQRGENNLWVSRRTGEFQVRPSWDLASQDNPECLGLAWGLVGKLTVHPDLHQRLVLVRQCERIGELPGRDCEKHGVYKVQSIVVVPIVCDNAALANLGLKPCPKHQPSLGGPEAVPFSTSSTPSAAVEPSVVANNNALAKLGGSLKLLASDAVKSTAGNAAALASQVKAPWTNKSSSVPSFYKSANVNKNLERFERRILDEFCKMFNGSDSFFFSFSGDLTNSLQRQMSLDKISAERPLWQRVDDRFFFNKHLLQELTDLKDSRADSFILPFIQGYIELQFSPLQLEEDIYSEFQNQGPMLATKQDDGLPDFYTIALISRRSRHRAGTRYKRRGVDSEGHVANYVETEQILLYHNYALSFVMTRGSVPVHWSQPGYKYRPPPKLDRTEEEDQAAFANHFANELSVYGSPVTCISLTERTGRERVIAEAFFNQALTLDSPDLTFVAFDFHEYCRGMHFENVSVLLGAVEEQVKAARYCWMDKHGVVCTQEGVFRVNCIDCLDRTNVVQTALARIVLETQLTKLGVVPPDTALPPETRLAFQGLWANNGDIISRQYAGTNALKGDFTRTGERNFSGLMKDGVNSASRYYLNQFRDAYRQATIDIMTGNPVSEDIMIANEDEADRFDKEEEDNAATAEHVKTLIEDCKKLLIPDLDTVVGAWGLIDNDPITGDLRQEDMDVIFILTKDAYFVARYEDEMDKVSQYQKVLLSNIEKIEFGNPESTFNLSFGRNQTRNEHSMRITYRMPSEELDAKESGFYHMFRATCLRFFNNMAVVVKNEDERIESLKSIADSVAVAMELTGLQPDLWFGKLDKKKSKVPDIHSNFNVFDSGESSVLKSAGSRAFASVTNQISKLNPISRLRLSVRKSNSPDVVTTPQDPKVLVEDVSTVSNEGQSSQVVSDESAATGEVESEARPSSNLANHLLLSPLPTRSAGFRTNPTLLRRKSRSNEELSSALDEDPQQAMMPQSNSILELEELAQRQQLTTRETLMAPFAKITRGLQNIGASLGPATASEERDAAESAAAAAAAEQIDPMRAKLQTSTSKTKIILL